MVLRWSARDGGSQMVSLGEAVTAVRVRVECGLLTEAFMHQRMLCTRVRENKLNYGPSGGATAHLKGEGSSWADWVEILVTEICCLCIRRNLVECLIALPWNSDEEKHIHTCLFDYAVEDPLRTTGSLLVVFYIQVCRGISTTLVDKSLELLPEVKRQQLRSGKLPEPAVPSQEEAEIPEKADLPDIQDPKSISLLIPSSANSSYLLHTDHTSGFLRPSIFETASRLGGSVYSFGSEFSNFGSSHERLVSNTERGLMPLGSIEDSFRYDSTVSPRTHQTNFMDTSPFKGKNRSSAGNPTYNIFGKLSPAAEQNGILFQNRYTSPLNSYRATANSYTRTTRNREFSKDFARDLDPNTSTKIAQPDREVRPWIMVSPDDLMDASCSHVENGSTFEDRNTDGGPRWRSDETSDEEEEQGLERAMGIAHHVTPTRRFRRSRLSKR
ncbi:E3 ubiquitin-protein ligase HOS1 [Quillaja saponaria]|uniref:E3 ubiquitin-protein ligase HOS1 n=1 Tax=Quillaja saponaria TaxID=32244 RepID=A0AAD7PF33_QUISA|nr:E3 ubiquitin-protein ligase HOS1 [Quillaja saponaria]